MNPSRLDYSLVERLKTRISEMVRAEDAVTSIEYALIGSLIAVVIVAAVGMTGTATSQLFAEVAKAVADATS